MIEEKINQLTVDDYLYNIIEQNERNDAKDILSLPPVLTILTLPYKNPIEEKGKLSVTYEKEIIRSNTKYSLSIQSGIKKDYDEKGNVLYGIPYGMYGRLLLYYICSEVNKTKSQTIILGSSYQDILKNITKENKNINGKKLALLKEQMDRLLNASIVFRQKNKHRDEKNEEIQETEYNKFALISGVKEVEFWDEKLKNKNHGYKIKISEDFYSMIIRNNNVVFDYQLIKKLKSSPIALDLALHINHWAYNATFVANKDLFISYDMLHQQFGTKTPLNDFKKTIKIATKKVKKAMPKINIIEAPTGIWIPKGSVPTVRINTRRINKLIKNYTIDKLGKEVEGINI